MEKRPCPRCGQTLADAKGPGLALDVCKRCGGVYFDHGELAQMANRRRTELDDVERLVEADELPPVLTKSRSLRCPGCSGKMESYEYAYCSGITLDRCSRCFGIWVDDGELQAIQDHLDKVHAGIEPRRRTHTAEDAAAAMAQMDAGIERARKRADAIRAFTGTLRMRRMLGFW